MNDSFFLPDVLKTSSKKKNKNFEDFEKSGNFNSYIESDDETFESATNDRLTIHSNNQTNNYNFFTTEILNNETADEKRVRLAKKYLDQLKAEKEDSDVDDEQLSKRIITDQKKSSLNYVRYISKEFVEQANDSSIFIEKLMRGHKSAVSSVALTPDDCIMFSGSKDGSLIKWDLETGKKLFMLPGTRGSLGRSGARFRKHQRKLKKKQPNEKIKKGKLLVNVQKGILSLAVRWDGSILATGSQDGVIRIYDVRKPIAEAYSYEFPPHSGPVTGLAFRHSSPELFSCSTDRTVKLWNTEEQAFVETMYGHTSEVMGVDCFLKERAISCGRDMTCRLWKVLEESQLVFNPADASIDAIKYLNEDHFISGGEDGILRVWNSQKRKPLCEVKNAHGSVKVNLDNISEIYNPRWISSIGHLIKTDIIASGSNDGFLRFWRYKQGFGGLKQIYQLNVDGFINSINFSNSGKFMIAGIGTEHRLGRWSTMREAKNGIALIKLPNCCLK
eukprot:TRINITY_DN489_c0_g1_i1.p1 TRINITY_DN489_c0_g1~~TRINITY_DN489_c0_g1_i1.p1  ORF type:complete len:502 (-),score=209.25 TRINITY_DN489_c0_g1_i1:139-1644(-)